MPRKPKATKNEEKILSFREQIFGDYSDSKEDSDHQRINVMTRVREDVIEIVDALIELGAFDSRSEAVAAYLEHAILSNLQLYKTLKARAKKVSQMRESAMDLAIEAFQESKK